MSAIGTALVSGGGIGGLTVAIALRQQGIAVDLVEAKPDFSVYGVGIIQPNNTLRALAQIGLADACVEAGGAFPGWRMHDADGRALMDAPADTTAAPGYPPVNGITRPRLHAILTDAARANEVAITFADRIADLADDGRSVAVRFQSGREAHYDLVVGSDGINSDLRRLLFGPLAPVFTGQGVWRYNLPRPADMEWGEVYFGADTKVGLVPMSDTLMYLLIVTQEASNSWFAGDDMAATMRARLENYGGRIAELRPLIVRSEDVVYRPMESLLLPAPWFKGRTVLIGDAAHSTTPHLAQGAAMAIEDAVLLGTLMGRDAPVETLLDEFMRRRFARAKFVVDSSRQIGEWELEAWAGNAARNVDAGKLMHSATLALMETY